MKYPWREEGRRSIYEGSRFITVFDRTKLKPRPEGYRDHAPVIMPMPMTASWKEEHGTWENFCKHVHTSIGQRRGSGTIQYATSFPGPEPVEALEPSETGKVPHEPSKGLHGASGGAETASCWRCKKPIAELFDEGDPETCWDCGSHLEAHSSRME